jgi:hypothetical protein
MATKTFKIDHWEAEELAAHICECKSDDRSEIEQAFCDKFQTDLGQFEDILQIMGNMLSFGISPLTEQAFIGFSVADKKHSRWIIKKEVNASFIAGVIQWLGGQNIKGDVKGYSRTVTNNGKPEYEITIKKYPLQVDTKIAETETCTICNEPLTSFEIKRGTCDKCEGKAQ